jgi:transposase
MNIRGVLWRAVLATILPDLNPIEQVFAKIKALPRKADERTIDGVWQRIGQLLKYFTPNECANYLRSAGYTPNVST